jgi:two-component system osmolarity sensor histidine kinase EnvZ
MRKLKNSFKKMLPQTLFGRSLLIMVTPVLLLQILVAFFFIDRHWDAMTARLAQSVTGDIALIFKTVDIDAPDFPAGDMVFLNSLTTTVKLTVLYEPGSTLTKTENTSSFIVSEIDTLADELRKITDRPFLIRSDRDEKWYEVLFQLEDGVLRVLFPERRLYSATSYIFILWLLGSSAILFAIAIIFMRNQIRPIRKLAMAAERFGRGIDTPKFKPHGAREVRQAAEAFHNMRERIQRQIDQRTAMLSGVSHDLRTPVTRMKLQLELLGDSPDVEALRTDLTDMEKMIEGYLAFVRGDKDEKPSAVDIGDFIAGVNDKLRRQDLTIHDDNIERGHILRIHPNGMERAIANLLTNACKYGKQAWVSVRKIDDDIEITVDDDGPGIADELHEEVFKPFYRVEQSRNPETGGVGLGLAVTQDIIHSHGGAIALEASPQGGLCVRIRLPFR